MTTDVYPRENCIAPAMVFIVWTTDTTNAHRLAPDCGPVVAIPPQKRFRARVCNSLCAAVYCIAPHRVAQEHRAANGANNTLNNTLTCPCLLAQLDGLHEHSSGREPE